MPDRQFRPSWPRDIERDVEEEIASHLAERQDEYIARGLDPDAAADAARRRFGDRQRVADLCRGIDRGVHVHERWRQMLIDLWQDVLYALRLLRRAPGFAVVAVLTLALGMGAATTIFTLANWVLLRPVPGVTKPADVSVFWVGRKNGDRSFSPWRLTYPNLADAVARLKTISLGAYQGGGIVAAAGGGQRARNVSAQYVTASYFDVLGVRMQVGRTFMAAEDRAPSPLLGAVISDRLWRSMFHGDPNILGQTIDIAGVRFAVLGVAAPGFHGTERISPTDLWLPGTAEPIVRHMKVRYDARDRGGYYELVARLKPGATWRQAEAELESLRAWLRDEYPTENVRFRTAGFHLMGPIGPPPMGRETFATVVGMAGGSASTLLLLIACANVAGLLLIRGIGRRGEIGVRKALGAGRWRLVRQHVTEGLLLWSLGGAAAMGLVVLLNQWDGLASLVLPAGQDLRPPIDWRVLAFSAGVSLLVGLLFSIVPALRATRGEAVDVLRASSGTATRRALAGTSMAALQLGASLTLLIGACLLTATLVHLTRVPLGFDPDDLFLFHVEPASIGYPDAAALDYVRDFQERLRRLPGVREVAAARGAPFAGGANMSWRVRAGDSAGDAAPIEVRSNSLFTTTYFDTLGIPLIRGRGFTEADIADGQRGTCRSLIISQNLAAHLFGAADPIGRELVFPGQGRGGESYQVIGVAGTARYRDLVTPAEEVFYEPAGPKGMGIAAGATIVVRAEGSVALAEQASAIATALNPALPLTTVLPMADVVGRARADWDSLALIVGLLAVFATVLASVGLYGVVAHGVAQRRHELGIRLALGATGGQMWQLVLSRTAVITAAGLCLGLPGGYAFARVLATRLVGVSPLDPLVWSAAIAALVAVAALASVIPARVATRVDVSETLRAL